ncbi:MAG: glycosyltransferase family 2 protein, partial [Microcoleus sp.]
STFVWIAWYLHRTGHHVEMAQFLQRSWNFTPYLPVETVINWADCFAEFYQESDNEFDADLLASSPEWQNLMQWILASQNSY